MTTTTEAMRLAREALADMLAEVDPDSTTARKRGREALAAIDAIPQHDAQPNCHSTRPDVAPPSRPDDYCTDIQCRVMGRCRYAAPAADIDEEQLARLSERGAVAWAGVDAQSLRDGGAELPAIPLYVGTAPAAQAQQPDDVRPHSSRTRKDALRYRWLRERLLSADFDYGGEGVAALVFELPAGSAVSADCDATIDGAMGLTPAETAATASVAGPAEHPSRADLIAALQFYAAGNHRITVDESAWDTVSGEPVQWLANETGDMVEDGTIAAQVLAGALTAEDLADGDDDDRATTAPAPLPAFDILAHLKRQAEFSAKTFGPGARVEGVTDHIAKELREVRESGGDLTEWVDVIILAFDGAWRSGASPAQIIDAMVAKQTKNEGRKWPDWRTAPAGKAIEHDRTGEVGAAPLLSNGLTRDETAATASVAIIDSPETGYPSRVIDGQHVPCAHDGRVHPDVMPATASVAGLAEPGIPDYALLRIQAYGDARADDDGTSAARLREAIIELRRWAGSLVTQAVPVPAPSDDWQHLKPHGYAPGNYMNKCHRCNQVVTGLDKRAVTCRPCAGAMHAQASTAAAAPEPVAWPITEDQARAAFWGCFPYTGDGEKSGVWMTAYRWCKLKATQPAPAVAATVPAVQALTDAARDVLAERQRQISAEGSTPEHDDAHSFGELARAGAALMTQSGCGGTLTPAVRRFAQACAALGTEAERKRCAEIAAPERIPYSDDEWRVRCEVRDAILDA